MKPVHLIVATEVNNIIGHGLNMVWEMYDDLVLNFLAKTKGNPVIMGANTALALGKPLKGRPCIAISTNRVSQLENLGFTVVPNLWEALAFAERCTGTITWIIGGGIIYSLGLQYLAIQEIHQTRIFGSYPCSDKSQEIKFCGFSHDQYRIDPSRTMEIKQRAPKTNDDKDRGNSNDATVEVWVRA